MYGAMIGDISGSVYEFDNIKTKDFPFYREDCDYTDDSVMTAAVAAALAEAAGRAPVTKEEMHALFVRHMRAYGRRYPYPTGAYGAGFAAWLRSDEDRPYNSCGNGSAMRVSPCGLIAGSLEEAETLAAISAEVSHNHPEGIKGAKAVAAAVFMAGNGASIEEIRQMILNRYYDIRFTLDEIRPVYRFEGTCQCSVPQALEAFFESTGFEDAIRNVISIGGDTDTTGAICGSVAFAYYTRNGTDQNIAELVAQAKTILPEEFCLLADDFSRLCGTRDKSIPIVI